MPRAFLMMLGVALIVACRAQESESRSAHAAGPARESDVPATAERSQTPPRRPTSEQVSAPPADLVGRWDSGHMYGANLFYIRKGAADGQLRVIFHTSGCLRAWTLEGVGRQVGSTLVLDSPVLPYCGNASDVVHVLDFRGETVLALPDGVDD